MSRPAVRPFLVLSAAVVLLVTGAAACGDAGDDEPGAAGTAVSPASETTIDATGAQEATDGAEEPTDDTTTAEVVDEVPGTDDTSPADRSDRLVLAPGDFTDVTPEFDGYGENFQSPSGNIQCVLSPGAEGEDGYVQCEVFEADWTVQEEADCELDWIPTELSLSDLPYTGGCRSDAFVVENPTTLQYGEGWSVGPISCMSREDGITCSNSETESGFRVSRRSYEVF